MGLQEETIIKKDKRICFLVIYSRLSRSFTARGSVKGGYTKGIRLISSRVTKLSQRYNKNTCLTSVKHSYISYQLVASNDITMPNCTTTSCIVDNITAKDIPGTLVLPTRWGYLHNLLFICVRRFRIYCKEWVKIILKKNIYIFILFLDNRFAQLPNAMLDKKPVNLFSLESVQFSYHWATVSWNVRVNIMDFTSFGERLIWGPLKRGQTMLKKTHGIGSFS